MDNRVSQQLGTHSEFSYEDVTKIADNSARMVLDVFNLDSCFSEMLHT